MSDTTPPTFDPETQWEALKAAMESGGADAAIAHVESLEDPSHQRQTVLFAVRAFDGREWEGKTFEPQIAFARWGIQLGLRQAEAESDPADRAKRIEFSNVLSYNFSANLAPCWPGDERPRPTHVLEAGLAAAEDCLRWRAELKKGPFPFSIAHWAKGIHLLGLGRDAVPDMQASLDHAVQHAADQGKPTDVSAEGTWSVCLAAGYLGLAERRAGNDDARYAEACAALEGMLSDPERKGDAGFCLSQLRETERRFAPPA